MKNVITTKRNLKELGRILVNGYIWRDFYKVKVGGREVLFALLKNMTAAKAEKWAATHPTSEFVKLAGYGNQWGYVLHTAPSKLSLVKEVKRKPWFSVWALNASTNELQKKAYKEWSKNVTIEEAKKTSRKEKIIILVYTNGDDYFVSDTAFYPRVALMPESNWIAKGYWISQIFNNGKSVETAKEVLRTGNNSNRVQEYKIYKGF